MQLTKIRDLSETTRVELKFAVVKSQNFEKNALALHVFLTGVQILPIFDGIDIYAKEKARLRKSGKLIDDLDLLLGSTEIAGDLALVTNDTEHFKNLDNNQLDNFIKIPQATTMAHIRRASFQISSAVPVLHFKGLRPNLRSRLARCFHSQTC